MGQITAPAKIDVLLTSVDRLTASNAANGMSPLASHIIALGQHAADNLPGASSDIIALGQSAAANYAAVSSNVIALGKQAGQLSGISNLVAISQGAGANISSATPDMIAVGLNAASAGLNHASLSNSIVIGHRAWLAQTTVGAAGSVALGTIIIGTDAVPLLQFGSANLIIGTGALPNYVGHTNQPPLRNVIIGGQAGLLIQNTGSTESFNDNVLIGHQVASRAGAAGERGIAGCVIIGTQAGGNQSTASNISGSVIIGFQAYLGSSSAGVGTNTIIGAAAMQTTTSEQCVVVGQGVRVPSGNGNVLLGQGINISGSGSLSNVLVGQSTGNSGATMVRNTILGSSPNLGNNNFTRCILIGYGAGINEAGNDILIVETNDGTKRTVLYGVMSSGNLIVGNSTTGTNRDMPGTNILKLINGTSTGTPSGGGFFYVSAGALHWKGSAGTDTVLAPA